MHLDRPGRGVCDQRPSARSYSDRLTFGALNQSTAFEQEPVSDQLNGGTAGETRSRSPRGNAKRATVEPHQCALLERGAHRSGGGNMMGMGMGGSMGRGMGLGGGMGGMPGGYGGRGNSFMGRGGGRGAPMGSSRSGTFTEGKLFLGGLDSTTTKESLTMYCSQW